MKIIKNLPLEKHKNFFDRYADLIPTLFWLGVIAQIISFLTELGIVYNVISSKLIDLPIVIDGRQIMVISWTAAIIGAAFFEIGLRKFIPYSIRCFLYDRFTGLDKVMSIFILSIALLLIGGSIALSYNGSKELVSIVSTPKKESTTKTDYAYNQKKDELSSEYRSDSINIASSYAAQIVAIEKKYVGKIGKQQSEIALYERKEQRRGLSYQSRKQVHRGNIAKLESELGEQIATLQATKRKELSNISSRRRTTRELLEKSYQNDLSKIDQKNKIAATEAKGKANLYGSGLAWFTVLCMVVFILSVVLDEVHKKGSGIVEQVLINQYDFMPSKWMRFWLMVNEKINQKIHSKITQWEKTTPSPVLPILQYQLFDLANIQQERISVEVEKLPNGKYMIPSTFNNISSNPSNPIISQDERPGSKVIDQKLSKNSHELEEKILSYLQSVIKLRECNLNNEADAMELKADQVIKTYLGQDATDDNTKKLRLEIIGFLNGENKNPFFQHHRQPIGFKPNNRPSSEPIKTYIRKSYNDTSSKSNERICEHCSTAYIYRHHKQKYCTDDCRKRAWEERTGKQLKLKRKK